MHKTYDRIPVIQDRINILQNINITKTLNEAIEKQLGKNVIEHIQEQPAAENQWVLYNYITWYFKFLSYGKGPKSIPSLMSINFIYSNSFSNTS